MTMFGQYSGVEHFIERMSAGSSALLATQGFFWCANFFVNNTGSLPVNIVWSYTFIGMVMAVLIGQLSSSSPDVCNSDLGLHAVDVYFPILLACIALPIVLFTYTRKVYGDVDDIPCPDPADGLCSPSFQAVQEKIKEHVDWSPFSATYTTWSMAEYEMPASDDMGVTFGGVVFKTGPRLMSFTGIVDARVDKQDIYPDGLGHRLMKSLMWNSMDHSTAGAEVDMGV